MSHILQICRGRIKAQSINILSVYSKQHLTLKLYFESKHESPWLAKRHNPINYLRAVKFAIRFGSKAHDVNNFLSRSKDILGYIFTFVDVRTRNWPFSWNSTHRISQCKAQNQNSNSLCSGHQFPIIIPVFFKFLLFYNFFQLEASWGG